MKHVSLLCPWRCTAGELYQAHFDTQEDAVEAFNAAGGQASDY